jgi:hypothetical protein
MITLTCDTCEDEIDVTNDPRCVVYNPSGATDVICEGCRQMAWERWNESMAAGEGHQRGCEALREAYRIKRGWRA